MQKGYTIYRSGDADGAYALLPIPPRAGRRPVLRPAPVLLSFALLILFERAVVAFLPELAALERRLLEALSASPVVSTEVIGVDVPRLAFDLSVPSYLGLVLWIGCSALALVLLLEVRRGNQALRIVLVVQTLLVLLSAVATLWTSRPPFEAEELSILLGETAPTLWLSLPLLVGLLTLAFPFSVLERLVLVVLVLVWLVVAFAVQQAFFAAAVEQVGSVLMAPLYLTAGPLVDVVGAVAIYAAMLARSSGRLARAAEPGEAWSWS